MVKIAGKAPNNNRTHFPVLLARSLIINRPISRGTFPVLLAWSLIKAPRSCGRDLAESIGVCRGSCRDRFSSVAVHAVCGWLGPSQREVILANIRVREWHKSHPSLTFDLKWLLWRHATGHALLSIVANSTTFVQHHLLNVVTNFEAEQTKSLGGVMEKNTTWRRVAKVVKFCTMLIGDIRNYWPKFGVERTYQCGEIVHLLFFDVKCTHIFYVILRLFFWNIKILSITFFHGTVSRCYV